MVTHNPPRIGTSGSLSGFALGDDAQTAQGVVMVEAKRRAPAGDHPPHAVPVHAALLPAPRKRAWAEPAGLEPEDGQRRAFIATPW